MHGFPIHTCEMHGATNISRFPLQEKEGMHRNQLGIHTPMYNAAHLASIDQTPSASGWLVVLVGRTREEWLVGVQKSMMGSPTVRFRSTVQGRLKSLAVMNLKILFTLMLCVALEKKRVAFIALAYALA